MKSRIRWEPCLDFSNRELSENAIRKTWEEFRKALANDEFTSNEIDVVKEQSIFLKQYDDLFVKHDGLSYNTKRIDDLNGLLIGRGTILAENEVPDYERFIPKKQFITIDNRFSPPEVEWLYLAIGNEQDIHQCAQSECRAKVGQRFGFCHFGFESRFLDSKLVDLTVADNISYDNINYRLEKYAQKRKAKIKAKAKTIFKKYGYIPNHFKNEEEDKQQLTEWGVYTYSKLLSEQIFEPLTENENKAIIYAPFQTMAQYYILLGYRGIIYKSTVYSTGKNIVLFDKNLAYPINNIEDYIIY